MKKTCSYYNCKVILTGSLWNVHTCIYIMANYIKYMIYSKFLKQKKDF